MTEPAPPPRTYKRPESVLVLVYTVTGDVLLLERNGPRGFWQSVTGSLEWGESAPAAALRELAEETGLRGVDIVDCERRNRFTIMRQWGSRFAPGVTENDESLFRVELPARVAITHDPAEHRQVLWLPRREAAAKVFSWTNRDAILDFVPESG